MKERRSDALCKNGKKLIRCEPPPPLPPGTQAQQGKEQGKDQGKKPGGK